MIHAAHPTMSRKKTMMKKAPRPDMCAIVVDAVIVMVMVSPGAAGDEVKLVLP